MENLAFARLVAMLDAGFELVRAHGDAGCVALRHPSRKATHPIAYVFENGVVSLPGPNGDADRIYICAEASDEPQFRSMLAASPTIGPVTASVMVPGAVFTVWMLATAYLVYVAFF